MSSRIKLPVFIGCAATGSLGFGLGKWYTKNEDEIRYKINGKNLFKYGLPEQALRLIPYEKHFLCYDHSKRIPVWVAERLDLKTITGDVDRKKCEFKVDPRIPAPFLSTNDDYWRSGWSRGHMAASGNYKSSLKEMSDTYFLTNIVPQNIENNGGYWNLIEIYCRDLVKRYKNIYVYSGPLFTSCVEEGVDPGKECVKYQVIGKQKVAVPNELYKIIVAENPGSRPAVGVFVVPNKSIPFGDPLTKYQVPLESLERTLGVKFVPKLNRGAIDDLCSVDGCKLMDVREFTIMYLSRRMAGQRTLKYLEKDWAEVKQKGLTDEPQLAALYEKKKAELAAVQPRNDVSEQSKQQQSV